MSCPCGGTAGREGRNLQLNARRARAGGSLRRARFSLTVHYSTGKFSRLHDAVNCLRQNEMRRFLVLVVPLLAAACGGGGSNTNRRTLVDSRDNYDPRSLDPALSTDVPTGRAVGYLFDGLTRFTPDARVIPALATSWEASADGLIYPFHL